MGGTRRSTITTLALIAIFVTLGVFGYYVFRGMGGNVSLDVGDCINAPAEPTPQAQIERKACSDEHDGEVFAIVTHTAAAGAQYPDVAEFRDLASDECVPQLTAYVAMDIATILGRGFDFSLFYPPPDKWASGARDVACFVINANGTKLIGSVRNAGTSSPTP